MTKTDSKDGKYKVNIARIADTDGPEKELPATLYYYCKLETALEHILPNKQLLLSPIKNTNDPRENKSFQFCCISPPDHPLYNDPNWEQKVSSILREDCKVLCFSMDRENYSGYGYSRMWAYYGGNHTGLCLALDTQKFIEENKNIIDINLLRRIHYIEQRLDEPSSHEWVDFARAEEIGDSKYIKEEFRQDHLQYLYFTKDKEWASEGECRLIHFSDITDNEYCSIECSLLDVYLGVDFHDSYIPSLKHLIPEAEIKRLLYVNEKLIPKKLE